ncbi:MAG: lysophospholipid acyltransferase family protein [Candidatus Margulisiibacteriota bacterium]|nr:lysophospholipid acyltransferase family protein [Candidatus Margulisiibacteriota bacterium]
MVIFLNILQLIFRIIFFLPAGIALAIMNFCALLTYYVVRVTPLRKNTENNIKLVLPHADSRTIADKLLKNTSYSIFEILCIPFFKKEHFHKKIRWHGERHLKNGAIILTMHAGNYELIPSALAHLGHKTTTVLRATDDPLFKIVNRSRSHGGAKLINTLEEDMYKGSLKALSEGELVFLLADTGALESRHEFFDFLGKKVPVATGWLTLAQRAGCPVIPTLTGRENGKNLIAFFDPIYITKENREAMMEKTAKVFEDFIKANPESWALFLNTYETKRMVEGK